MSVDVVVGDAVLGPETPAQNERRQFDGAVHMLINQYEHHGFVLRNLSRNETAERQTAILNFQTPTGAFSCELSALKPCQSPNDVVVSFARCEQLPQGNQVDETLGSAA